jgi:hypothetical protein
MMATSWGGGMWGMLGALPMLLWWVFAIFAAVAIVKTNARPISAESSDRDSGSRSALGASVRVGGIVHPLQREGRPDVR